MPAAPRRLPLLLAGLAAVSLLIAGGIWFAGGFGGGEAPAEVDRPVVDADGGDPLANPRAEITVGGVRRPASDVRRAVRNPAADADRMRMPEYGRIEPVPADTNANTRSVAEALRTGQNPERLSAIISPAPFDEAAYRADPQAYLNVIEPGRGWQSRQPGPDVPRLVRLSPPTASIVQGETTGLRVKAVPGAPDTFTSFNLGAFQNRLLSSTGTPLEVATATSLTPVSPPR